MKLHRPLSFSVLVYDMLRIIILMIITAQPRASSLISPTLMSYLLAPQILFTFMALFIWIDDRKYRNYIPLYTVGKVLGLWAALLWIFSSFQSVLRVILMYTGSAGEPLMLVMAVLIPFDCITVVIMAKYLKKPVEDN